MQNLIIFDNKKIRRIYDEEKEVWYFSVVDIISALEVTGREPRKYWSDLKSKLKEEGSEVSEKIGQLKMLAEDGKMRETDAADTEIILRIIQSVPSPKAEPIKLWLAKVGYERMKEITDPEISIDRARNNWKRGGRTDKWIERRMMGQETRNKLTDYWDKNGVKKGEEYAILTNIIHQEWAEVSVKEHKKIKSLKTENLRDHMSEAELIFTALAEMSTREIAENINSQGFEENKVPAKKGGQIAKNARVELENKTSKKVISGGNFKKLK